MIIDVGRRLSRVGDFADVCSAGDDGFGDFGEASVVVAGVDPQAGERFVHVDLIVFRDHALGLFDRCATSQGVL